MEKAGQVSPTGPNKPAFKNAMPKFLNVKMNFSLTPFFFLLILPKRH